jgi:hypothetical protein
MAEAAEGATSPTGVPGGRRVERRVSTRRWMIAAWMEDSLWVAVLFAPGLLLLPMVSGEPPGDPNDAALVLWLLVIWVVTLGLGTAWRIHVLPQHLTQQYLQADERGLLLTQERMWWFPGRELAVPWSGVSSVVSEECSINDARRRLLVVYLTGSGAGTLTRVPSFVFYRERDQHWHGTAPLPRLIIYPRRRGEAAHEIVQQVREVHPAIVDATHGA